MADVDFDWTAAWRTVEAGLPAGWRLDSLRCASSGITPAQRSDDWIAVAIDPAGGAVEVRAASAEEALRGLERRTRDR